MKVNANPLNYTDEITIQLSAKEAEALMEHIELNWPSAWKGRGGPETIELHEKLTASILWRKEQEDK